ncbi:hypothetical protein QBC35DRAFT_62438 [Podospora australis]|uniref:Uncharacterized protein n=1 Tax=Podospora australis TaxID=1536484 RepID=A0AAN6WZT1_9PEZI|nr:hypothetical protein QBC35DRAFT_62438 [Podospora australis]
MDRAFSYNLLPWAFCFFPLGYSCLFRLMFRIQRQHDFFLGRTLQRKSFDASPRCTRPFQESFWNLGGTLPETEHQSLLHQTDECPPPFKASWTDAFTMASTKDGRRRRFPSSETGPKWN